jgi:hypothetical protein
MTGRPKVSWIIKYTELRKG